MGRFLNADAIDNTLENPGDVLSGNLFAYCTNNPVNHSDPDGTWKLPNWAKLTIGVVAIAAAVTLTVLTGGALTPLLIGVAVSTVSGAAIGGAVGYATGGKEGLKSGLVNGAVDGFMWGGIGAFASSGVGAVKFLSSAKGAVQGTNKLQTLKPGLKLDRYGSLKGKYLTNLGTNPGTLSLPPTNSLSKTTLEVVKSIRVISGKIAPNFGGQGGGIQYYTRYSIETLIKKGFLK